MNFRLLERMTSIPLLSATLMSVRVAWRECPCCISYGIYWKIPFFFPKWACGDDGCVVLFFRFFLCFNQSFNLLVIEFVFGNYYGTFPGGEWTNHKSLALHFHSTQRWPRSNSCFFAASPNYNLLAKFFGGVPDDFKSVTCFCWQIKQFFQLIILL